MTPIVKLQGVPMSLESDLEIPADHTAIAITGHRPDNLGNDYTFTSDLMGHIRRRLMALIVSRKPDFMISGMALGIDTLWAMLAIENKIPLIAAIPFEQQDSQWANRSRSLYHQLLGKAYAVVNVSGQVWYKPEYMPLRNKWMVDHCSHLVAVFDGSIGGTYNCVKYAKTRLRPEQITIINPQLITSHE